MKFTRTLSDHVLKLMDPADRKKLGLKTMDEINQMAEAKTERELHKQVANLLRLRGIEFFDSRMDKRTSRPVGEPDFVFAVWIEATRADKNQLAVLDRWPAACGWELKLPGKNLDPDQAAMFEKLTKHPNAWICRVIRSVDEALAELKKLGL